MAVVGNIEAVYEFSHVNFLPRMISLLSCGELKWTTIEANVALPVSYQFQGVTTG